MKFVNPFKNMHPNKGFAFLDGFLCGIVVTGLGYVIYKDWKEAREFERECAEAKNEAKNVKTDQN